MEQAARLLFGSDFMINLMKTDSYADYCQPFLSDKNAFSKDELRLFFHDNPRRFLFAGDAGS